MLQVKSKKLQHPKKKNFLLVLVPIHVLTISIPLFSGQNLNFHRPHTKKIVCRVFQQTGAGHWDPSPASRAAFSMSALANVSSDSLILASMLTWRWSSDGEEKNLYIYIYVYLLFIYLFNYLFSCIYIYIHIFINFHIYIFIYLYIFIYMFIYLYIYIFIFIYFYIYLDIYTYLYLNLYLNLYLYTFIYLYI